MENKAGKPVDVPRANLHTFFIYFYGAINAHGALFELSHLRHELTYTYDTLEYIFCSKIVEDSCHLKEPGGNP